MELFVAFYLAIGALCSITTYRAAAYYGEKTNWPMIAAAFVAWPGALAYIAFGSDN